MSSGFNTDVHVGIQVFHVQTEDRGPASPVIDTTVYQNGRVVLRRSSNYFHYAASDEFDPDDLRERVEEQHRSVIEDLRFGHLDAEIATGIAQIKTQPPPTPAQAVPSDDLEVQLLNPTTWFSDGKVLLDIETRRRADRRPEPGVLLKAAIEGALRDENHEVRSDGNGRARIEFPMPPLGPSEVALLILASHALGKAEIRFVLRSRPKSPFPTASA